MGEISDALRRERERQQTDTGARERGDLRPDRFGATEATRILEESRRSSAPSAPGPQHEADKSLPEASPDTGTTAASRPLGVRIPRERTGSWQARTVLIDRRGGQAEAYRHFALRLSRELTDRSVRSVMVASALRHEGKSTTACNLALALASMAGGRRTALVDFDLRRPSVGGYLEVHPPCGVDSVLRGEVTLQEAMVATDLPSLDLYPVSQPMSDPHELLAGPVLERMLVELESAYDTVVVDSPPLLLVPDGHLILPHVGGLVAVLRARKTRISAFEQMIERIPDGKLIGSFINESRRPRHSKQYGYYLDEHRDTDDAKHDEEA